MKKIAWPKTYATLSTTVIHIFSVGNFPIWICKEVYMTVAPGQKIKFTVGTVIAHKFLGMTVGGLDTASIPQANKKKKRKSIV